MDLHIHGNRAYARVLLGCKWEARRSGRPDEKSWENSWKPVHAGGHIVHIRETRFNGIHDGTATESHMEDVN